MSTRKAEEEMKEIKANLAEMNKKIQSLDNKVESGLTKNPGNIESRYSSALQKKIERNVDQLVENQNRQNQGRDVATETAEKNERTLLVKRYKDKKLRNSGDIRRQVNKDFKTAAIRYARTTVGGSILLEFENKQTADKVKEEWKLDMFGGNEGIENLKQDKAAGIIKYVYHDEDNLEEVVKDLFPGSEVELFTKSNKFTGTIKVNFESENELEEALKNPVKINHQRYIMDKYIYRPRLVQCYNCQRFAHVARLCWQGTVCGKCSSTQHETRACPARPTEYKCYHCDGNHASNSKDCEVGRVGKQISKLTFFI